MENGKSANTEIDPELSKRITALRFLLSTFVVTIHSGALAEMFENYGKGVEVSKFFLSSENFITNHFFICCAVPLFFFFSGYLYFAKRESYGTMLKKRLRSIVLPYFLWIFSSFVLFFIADSAGLTRNHVADKTAAGWLKIFSGFPADEDGTFYPFLIQFWYLRELMLVFVLSPLIKKIIDKWPILYFCATFIFWQSSLPLHSMYGQAFIFFPLGYCAVKYNITAAKIDKLEFRELGIVYGLVIAAQTAEYVLNRHDFQILQALNIILSCLLILKFAGLWVKKEKIFAGLQSLSVYSFWIFAVHTPLTATVVNKLILKFIPAVTPKLLFAIFFLRLIFIVSLSLLSGILCKKLFPSVFSLYTGGRIRRNGKLIA